MWGHQNNVLIEENNRTVHITSKIKGWKETSFAYLLITFFVVFALLILQGISWFPIVIVFLIVMILGYSLQYVLVQKKPRIELILDNNTRSLISVPDDLSIPYLQIKNVEFIKRSAPLPRAALFGLVYSYKVNSIQITTDDENKILHGFVFEEEDALKIVEAIKSALSSQ